MDTDLEQVKTKTARNKLQPVMLMYTVSGGEQRRTGRTRNKTVKAKQREEEKEKKEKKQKKEIEERKLNTEEVPSEQIKKPETNETTTTNKLYCICQEMWQDGVQYIRCDYCEDWFHGNCIGINEKGA